MRIAASALVLAAVASVGSAGPVNGVQNGLAAGQTTGELQCKKAQTAFLACSLANDYNFTTNAWIDASAASCYPAAQTGLTGCRGGTALQVRGGCMCA